MAKPLVEPRPPAACQGATPALRLAATHAAQQHRHGSGTARALPTARWLPTPVPFRRVLPHGAAMCTEVVTATSA